MLTTSQKECLEKLKEHRILVRYNGGFWSRDKLLIQDNGKADQFDFYFSSVTINALISLGLVCVVKSENIGHENTPLIVSLKD